MKIKKFGRTFKIKQWKGEKLGSVIGVDTETELIKHEGHVPRLVVTTAYDGSDTVYIIKNDDVPDFLLKHSKSVLVYHNAPFDLDVLGKEFNRDFFEQVENDLIHDTAVLFQLVAIAERGFTHSKFSLDFCVSNILKDVLPKDDNIRLTFGQFILENGSIDYKNISKEHYIYACLDPIATFLIYENLMKRIKLLPTSTNLCHKIHLMGAMGLYDIRKRGIGVDLEYSNKLREDLQEKMNPLMEILASYGWVRGQKGLQDVYNGLCDFFEFDLPTNEKGYSAKSEDLEKYRDNPFVSALLTFLELEHHQSFLNELTAERIHPYYDNLKNTTRTSCSKPNMQQIPVSGGIREAFIPKKSHKFIDVDYSAIEMFTAAHHLEVAYGNSEMFKVLQEGKDPHIYVASSIHSIPESEVTKHQRQGAKPANYGFLADMSPKTFIPYAAGYGQELTLAESTQIKKGWKKAYPKVNNFFKEAGKVNRSHKTYLSRTGFVRANCSYTAWLNSHFQEPAACGAKLAMYLCLKAGLKMVAFIHDQIVCEEHEDVENEKLELLKECMVTGMKIVCPMNIGVDGEIKDRYSK